MTNTSTLNDWERCIEADVHANMHALHGGTQKCRSGLFEEYQAEHPGISDDLLSFIGVNAPKLWSQKATPYLDCPSSCGLELPTGECLCQSKISTDQIRKMDRNTVETLIEPMLMWLQQTAHLGSEFIERREQEDGSNKYQWKLEDEDELQFSYFFLEFILNPGVAGAMASGAAANDPLFWPIHPIFDKSWHALRLSPQYSAFSLSWKDGEGYGSKFDDSMPFKDLFTDYSASPFNTTETRYSNRQLNDLFAPTSSSLTYVYDQFIEWGVCQWDPLDINSNTGVELDFIGSDIGE